MDDSSTDVGVKAIPPTILHEQDDLNEKSSSSTDVGVKVIPPPTPHEQDNSNEKSLRMDGSSASVGVKVIPPPTLHEQDDYNEKALRVTTNLSNGTPLRDGQKSTTNIVAVESACESVNGEGHTLALNREGHNIASSSKINEDIVDEHACWGITGGLTSAEKTSEWYQALFVSDCKSLMEQLCVNPLLVIQTGHNGCTVLHAAARRGCTPLVDQVMRLFKNFAGKFNTAKDRTKIFQSPLDGLFQAVDFRTKLRAVEIMQYFMGNDVIQRHMDDFYVKKLPPNLRLSVSALSSHGVERKKTTYGWHKGAESKSVSSKDNPSSSSTRTSANGDQVDENLLKKIRQITNDLLKNERFKALVEQYSKDRNYNFDKTRKEFIFHYGCQSILGHKPVKDPKPEKPDNQITRDSAEDFLRSFMKECMKLGEGNQENLQGLQGEKILRSLYETKNWQGLTPCHAALYNVSASGFENLLGLLQENDPKTITIFLNACDARGWTPLHKAVAMVSAHDSWKQLRFLNLLLKHDVRMDAKLPISNATPLHLAILYNLPQIVDFLIQSQQHISEGVLNASLKRKIHFSNTTISSRQSSNWWSPLQLATVMGHPSVVAALMTKINMIYDESKLKNKGAAPKNYDPKMPAMHLAAASGVPEVLQLFLDKKKKMFDPTKTTIHKRSTLHFAVDTTAAYMGDKRELKVLADDLMNPFQCILDFGDAQHLETIISKASSKKRQVVGVQFGKDQANNHQVVRVQFGKDHAINLQVGTLDQATQSSHKPQLTTLEEYGGKQTCITMLLQNGVDIWQRDDQEKPAELGANTCNEIRSWWFKTIAKETTATKKILNDAANAISVVATLIATASYAGPLQPPLGFGSVTTSSYFDFVQTSSIPVQIFVVSNCLSFYLAIGSIMFAIVPSVPMPKQGIGFEEWRRSRRTVGAALSLLLLSVFCVLVSFAAASNAGMSDNSAYNHVGLAFYPALFGGVSCLIGIIVFFMGFLKFITSFGIDNIKEKLARKPNTPSGRDTKGNQVGDETLNEEATRSISVDSWS